MNLEFSFLFLTDILGLVQDYESRNILERTDSHGRKHQGDRLAGEVSYMCEYTFGRMWRLPLLLLLLPRRSVSLFTSIMALATPHSTFCRCFATYLQQQTSLIPILDR